MYLSYNINSQHVSPDNDTSIMKYAMYCSWQYIGAVITHNYDDNAMILSGRQKPSLDRIHSKY